MNFSGSNMRNRRNLLDLGFAPIHFPIGNYSTDARQTETKDMKHQYDNTLFNNLHLIPDPLKKNLADSVITGEEKKKMPETKEYAKEVKPTSNIPKPPHQREYYPSFTGITNFISGVFNIMGAMFAKRSNSPSQSQYYDCFDYYEKEMAPLPWQPSNIEVLNKNQTESLFGNDSYANLDLGMSIDCKLAANQCEDKLNQVRLLLSNKNQQNNVQTSKYRSKRPKKVFVEPNSVEDSFEDAFSPEDFVSLPNENHIELYSPFNYHDEVFTEAEAPKIKTETKESMDIVKHIEESSKENESKNNESLTNEKTTTTKEDIILACEDKLSKLKALLQLKKCKAQETQPVPIPVVPTESLQNSQESDGFNEFKGKFFSSSVESDDSFQIVFSDGPQNVRRRLPSDCESEDSFIVFEESPDSCYLSHDVFGHENDKDCNDSDSDIDDSGYTCKLSPSLSRTFGDLTDTSLYSHDEVDSVSFCDNIAVDKEEPVTAKTGLLLDEKRKLEKRNLPPKKVQFSTQPPKVHVMRVWAFAARQARAGHWERHALDRERFKRRIADVEMAISWVLKPQHRSRIVFQRFRPWWNGQRRKELAEKKEQEEKEKKDAERKEQERREKNEAEKIVEFSDKDIKKELSEMKQECSKNLDDNSKDSLDVVNNNAQKDEKKNESGKNSLESRVEMDENVIHKYKNCKKVVEKTDIFNTKIENIFNGRDQLNEDEVSIIRNDVFEDKCKDLTKNDLMYVT